MTYLFILTLHDRNPYQENNIRITKTFVLFMCYSLTFTAIHISFIRNQTMPIYPYNVLKSKLCCSYYNLYLSSFFSFFNVCLGYSFEVKQYSFIPFLLSVPVQCIHILRSPRLHVTSYRLYQFSGYFELTMVSKSTASFTKSCQSNK